MGLEEESQKVAGEYGKYNSESSRGVFSSTKWADEKGMEGERRGGLEDVKGVEDCQECRMSGRDV